MKKRMKVSEVLRNYKIHCAMYKFFSEEYEHLSRMGDVKAQEYSERVDTGGHVRKPVEDHAQRLDYLSRVLRYLDEMILTVDMLEEDLEQGQERGGEKNSVMLNILRSHYIRGKPIKTVTARYDMSSQQIHDMKRCLLSEAEKKRKQIEKTENE